MPSIRFRYNYGKPIVTQAPGDKPVELLKTDGSWERAHFAGFICKAGLELVPGQIAKMAATMVTNGNPISGTWRELGDNECALVYVIDKFGESYNKSPVCYGLVDRQGWPIVVPLNRPNPPPRAPAEVVALKAS